MKINDLIQMIKSKKWLRNHIGYFHEDLFDLSDNGFESNNNAKKVIIVSRKYYQESWATYPSINLKELKELLKLQKDISNADIQLQTYHKNKQQEGFDVKTISFNKQLTERFKNCALIPETELLAHYFLNDRTVAEVMTPAGTLFFTYVDGKTQSAYKQGLMSSVERFTLSIGVAHTASIKNITIDQYALLLWNTLQRLPVSKFHKVAAFDLVTTLNYKVLHSLYLAPLACATLFICVAYGYYAYTASALEQELSGYQSGINELLTKKQNIDIAKQYVDQVTNEFKAYPRVHSDWDIAYKAISEGMAIQQFSSKQHEIKIRGFADSASKVLTEISNLPQLKNAQFNGPLRKSGERDYFIMELSVVEKNEE